MNWHPFFVWLESTALSQWVIGSPSMLAFPGILVLHALGMGFAVGVGLAIDLRVLGIGSGIPLGEMRRYLPVFWAGFWLNAFSGALLLIGYPTKALTNPVFYLKLVLIAAAVVLLVMIVRRTVDPGAAARGGPASVPTGSMRAMAIASMLCWAGAITAGRLLAYTYTRLTAVE